MGWLRVPTSVMMAATTFLTTLFHHRLLRHFWLVVGFVGSAACVWWLSSIDNFTPEENSRSCWAAGGAFLGLIPPVFLTDEIEGLDLKDILYAGAIGILGLVVPIISVPNATGTTRPPAARSPGSAASSPGPTWRRARRRRRAS